MKRENLKSNIFALIAFFILYSCSESTKDQYISLAISNGKGEVKEKSFNTPGIPLVGSPLNIGEIIDNPRDIETMNHSLIISEAKSDNLTHIIDLDNRESSKVFDNKGYGPGEMLSASFLQFDKGSHQIIGFDQTLSKLTFISIDSIENDDYNPEQLNIERPVYNPIVINEDVIVGLTYSGEGRLAKVNSEGKIKEHWGELPQLEGQSHNPAILAQAYASKLSFNKKAQKIVVSSRYSDMLEVFDLKGNLLTKIRGPQQFDPIFSVRNSGDYPRMASDERMRFGFVDVYASDNGFYALYSGKSREEVPGAAHYGSHVYHFDYDGNLQKVYRLDRRVLRIAVDNKEENLYASDLTKEPHDIYKFNI